jgi:hypothetical protein
VSGHRPWSGVRRTLPPTAGDYARRLAEADPRFIRAYWKTLLRRRNPPPLCIDGREHHRRQQARRRRRR